jgi:hypothetical protein
MAITMVNNGTIEGDEDFALLQENLALIRTHAAVAGAVMLGWGANAKFCRQWFETVIEEIRLSMPVTSGLYCLGKTQDGYPKHPMERGKHKIYKDDPLQAWSVG